MDRTLNTGVKPAETLPQIDVVTFGCRLNAYESQVMKDLAINAGLSDTIIINTCAVTAEAERQARQAIRRLRRERPKAHIMVTGCAVQVSPEKWAAVAGIDRVLGNAEKMRQESWLGNGPRVAVGDIMTVRETATHMIDGFAAKTRAFIEIQQGCDHRCTFCIIPFGRGNNRSVPLGNIVSQVRRLVDNKVAEIVLTGVDITGYGTDLPGRPSLGQMLRRLLTQVTELKRLRLSSIDVAEAAKDEALWELIANESRLMPHLHLSLQSGDDLILKRMKRRHSRKEAIAFAAQAQAMRPDLVLGADFIAGFPTETEDAFARTLDMVDACSLSLLHVFPFSAREGTPAARMPAVPKVVVKERAARLREKGEQALQKCLERQVGRKVQVLVETKGEGRTEHYLPARVLAHANRDGMISGKVVGFETNMLHVAS